MVEQVAGEESLLPDTAAGRQCRWVIDAIRGVTDTGVAGESDHFVADAFTGTPGPASREEFWRAQRQRLGTEFVVKDVAAPRDNVAKVTLESADGREWHCRAKSNRALPRTGVWRMLNSEVYGAISPFDGAIAYIATTNEAS